jgi:uncharacterized pyridoxamine 5'-phosphate oxidase family protein
MPNKFANGMSADPDALLKIKIMKEIDYLDLKSRIITRLDSVSEIVLSTSYKNRVTSRTVSFRNFGLMIYFITSKAYTKYKQLSKNQLVSLCHHELQIEGVANIRNHPENDENKSISEQLKSTDYTDIFKKYSKYKNSVLIEVIPHLITLYSLSDKRSFFEYLDIKKEIALRKG